VAVSPTLALIPVVAWTSLAPGGERIEPLAVLVSTPRGIQSIALVDRSDDDAPEPGAADALPETERARLTAAVLAAVDGRPGTYAIRRLSWAGPGQSFPDAVETIALLEVTGQAVRRLPGAPATLPGHGATTPSNSTG
jgi:hypothetical protein